jgi:phage gp29-like protein
MPQLLDQHGQPLRLSDIAEPQTSKIATLQNLYHEGHLAGLTPTKAARILQEADQGNIVAQHQLFADMLDRDAHLACEFGKRSGALLGLDWSIEPPANASAKEKKDAAWVEEILRDVVDDLEDVITAMMGAVGHGFSAVELEWQRWDGEWLPKFHPRPQSWFQLSRERSELRLMDGSADGAVPIPMGWIMHQHGKAQTGYLARMGICRVLIWPFIYKHYAIGDFAEFLETYGLPIILGKYYQGATPAEKSSLMRAVTALGHDARAIMPKEMELEIQKITSSGDGSVHLAMVDWAERAQSKAILGQTLSAEAKATGMGSGVADLHADVRHDILKADARQIAGTLTRDLIYPLLTLNGRGGNALRRCPRWVFDLGESEDIKLFADALPALAAGGAKIPVSWVHEKLRIPMAEDGEEVFGAAAELANSAVDAGNSPKSAENPGAAKGLAVTEIDETPAVALKAVAPAVVKDALTTATDHLAQAAAPTVGAWVDDIATMLDQVSSLEEFRELLLARYQHLPAGDLVTVMATALATVNLRGRAEVEAGQ